MLGSAMAASSMAFAGSSLHATGQTRAAGATSPSRAPRLLAGLCAFSFGPFFKKGEMNFESFLQRAVELRADAVDITGYYLESTEPTYLAHLRSLAFRNGMPFTGVACGATLLSANKDTRGDKLLELRRWIDITVLLAAPHLRIFAGRSAGEGNYARDIDDVVERMKEATDYAGRKGIVLGLENQRGVTETADRCLEIVHRVDSPFAGINLDITHFVPTPTQDNYQQIAACIPVATHTHIRGGMFDDGTVIDLNRIWTSFAREGYRGYMSVEYESQGKSAAQINNEVPKLMQEDIQLCRTYSAA